MSWREYFDKPISRYCPTIEVDKKQLFKLFDVIDNVLRSVGLPTNPDGYCYDGRMAWYTAVLEANSRNFSIIYKPDNQHIYYRNLEDENTNLKNKVDRQETVIKNLRGRVVFLGKENERLTELTNRLKSTIEDLREYSAMVEDINNEKTADVDIIIKTLNTRIERLESENSVLREGKERVVIIRELPPITATKGK